MAVNSKITLDEYKKLYNPRNPKPSPRAIAIHEGKMKRKSHMNAAKKKRK